MLPLLCDHHLAPQSDMRGPARVAAVAAGWDRRAVWPLRPAVVIGGFDPPEQRWQPGHRGLDLAASANTPVRAAAAGVVVFSGEVGGRSVVVVSHGDLRTTYEPVAGSAAVGAAVAAGEVIGRIAPGAGHCGDGRCLHWGLRAGDRYLDPRLMLGARPVLRR